MKYKDLTGSQFERLTVIEFAGCDKHRRATWLCSCSCGKETIVAAPNLLRGYTKSCGCLFKELNSGLTINQYGKRTRLYQIWGAMQQRCHNPRNKTFEHYGGRGINICNEWLKFKPFYEWAMANGYDNDLTIDRIDNDGGYEAGNCRWATFTVQCINRRFNQSQGVTWHKSSGKWYARVIRNRKVVFAQLFEDFNEACSVVQKVRLGNAIAV